MHTAIWPVTGVSQFGVGLVSAAALGGCYVAYLGVRPTVLRMLRDPEDEELALQEAKAALPR
ncbi:MAG TPA: hypothetical protein VFU06_05340 [Longimicrobiales bacterium]|nr:hypothetical protein [Longimicrobiales bacterium]